MAGQHGGTMEDADELSLDNLSGSERRSVRSAAERMLVLPDTDEDNVATGLYDVLSTSGNVYRTDPEAGAGECPDQQHREPEGGCKHLRRVKMMLARTPLPERGESADDYDGWLEQEIDAINGDLEALAAEMNDCHRLLVTLENEL